MNKEHIRTFVADLAETGASADEAMQVAASVLGLTFDEVREALAPDEQGNE